MTTTVFSSYFALPSVAVAGVLAIAALLGLRWWLLDCPQGLRRIITTAMFVVGFACGVSGFMSRFEALDGGGSTRLQLFVDAVHSSFQLIFFGVDAKNTQGVRLGIARVLLPLATTQLVLATLLTRARQWVLRARLRVRRPDIMILGCGETGLLIARLFERLIDPTGAERSSASSAVRGRILGVDESLTSEPALAFQERYLLLQAPLGSEDALPTIGLSPRSGVVVCTGDEQRDLAILKKVVATFDTLPPVVVSVTSDSLPRTCRLDPDLSEPYMKGAIQFVNPAHLDARLLYRSHPPHGFAGNRFRVGGRVPCHVALFVSPDAVDPFGAQAVRALVYDPDEALRLTILAEDARAAAERFFARYPALTQSEEAWKDVGYGGMLPLARVTFLESRPDRIDPVSLRRAHAAQALDVMYVLGRTDGETCLRAAEALKVVATLDGARPGIVVCLRDLSAGRHLAETDKVVEWRFFGLASWAAPDAAASELATLLQRERTPTEATDAAAKRLWTAYRSDPKAKSWWETQHDVKWWNRFAADHADVKLALLGLTRDAGPADLRLALQGPGVRERLARLEHRRYVCERVVDGWLACREKIEEYRLNPTLAPFDAPQVRGQQWKDDAIVNDLLEVMKD